MLGVQLKNAQAGHRFHLAQGAGIMLYNNNGANLEPGDVVVVGLDATYNWIAVLPCDAAASVYHDLVVCLETVPTGKIGRFALFGDYDNDGIEPFFNSDSTNGGGAIAAGDYLECIPAYFDGTNGNLTLTVGSGSTKDTLVDSDSGLVVDDFVAGQYIIISGATTSANDGRYEIYSVAAGTITLNGVGLLDTTEVLAAAGTVKAVGQLEKGATTRQVTSVGRATDAQAAIANLNTASALGKAVLFSNPNTIAAR